MKLYEKARLLAEHFLPPLQRQVRLRLEEIIKPNGHPVRLLDVGGRKSPYTIGLPALVTVIDLPRRSEIQKDLNLGINAEISDSVKAKRSNVSEIIIGDMTRSGLPDDSFDHVVSVEVLEHVEEDEKFVSEVARVLKPGGFFLMTTPNGDWVENKNPDHKRHYKKHQLQSLLEKHFADVRVEYAIASSRFRKMGLKSWSLKRPVQTLESIIGNVVNARQSAVPEVRNRADHTHHLIATAGN